MKTLIQNYSSALSTEAMYFHKCLTECNQEAVMWSDPNHSAFDTFDFTKPDVFISHFKFLTHDIIKYLSINKQIAMVLNVSGAQQEDIDMLASMVKEAGVNVPFVFTNLYKSAHNLSSKEIKIEGIYPAADIFIPRIYVPEYQIDTCIFSVSNNELVSNAIKGEDNYHVASLNNGDESGYADMFLDVTSAVSFYERYKKIVLADDINVVTSQLLFDAFLRCQDLKIKVPDSQQDQLDQILSDLFIETEEDGELGQILKKQIKKRHNCFKRSARLFRFLKNSDLASQMERTSDSL